MPRWEPWSIRLPLSPRNTVRVGSVLPPLSGCPTVFSMSARRYHNVSVMRLMLSECSSHLLSHFLVPAKRWFCSFIIRAVFDQPPATHLLKSTEKSQLDGSMIMMVSLFWEETTGWGQTLTLSWRTYEHCPHILSVYRLHARPLIINADVIVVFRAIMFFWATSQN